MIVRGKNISHYDLFLIPSMQFLHRAPPNKIHFPFTVTANQDIRPANCPLIFSERHCAKLETNIPGPFQREHARPHITLRIFNTGEVMLQVDVEYPCLSRAYRILKLNPYTIQPGC
jgi:hypothetical protein